MTRMGIVLLLSAMIVAVGCADYGAGGASVPARQDSTQGAGLAHPDVDQEEENSDPAETENESETSNQLFFYFSYDDSSSTAAHDLTKFYIENGLDPFPDWGRAYEYLNAERFGHFAPETLGPFEVSAGLYRSTVPHFPGVDLSNIEGTDLYSLGVNVTGPQLSKSERPNIVGTFLVDISGSMETGYAPETRADIDSLLDVAKHGLLQMTDALKEGDVINLVTFDTSAAVVLEDWAYDTRSSTEYTATVDSLRTRGSTNLNEGIELAYRVAQRTYDPEKSNRVVILTDAYANTGEVSPTVIADNTVINGREGIHFAGVGIGNTFDDRFLNELTDIGKGNYVAMITPEDAERIFVSQFTSFVDSAVSDVRFRLDYPSHLRHLAIASAAEELSTDLNDIQTTHFAYNSQQFFLEHFAQTDFDDGGVFRLTVSYLGDDGQRQTQAVSFTTEELLGLGRDSILSATMATTLANTVADRVTCNELIQSDLFNMAISDPIYTKYQSLANDLCWIR